MPDANDDLYKNNPPAAVGSAQSEPVTFGSRLSHFMPRAIVAEHPWMNNTPVNPPWLTNPPSMPNAGSLGAGPGGDNLAGTQAGPSAAFSQPTSPPAPNPAQPGAPGTQAGVAPPQAAGMAQAPGQANMPSGAYNPEVEAVVQWLRSRAAGQRPTYAPAGPAAPTNPLQGGAR